MTESCISSDGRLGTLSKEKTALINLLLERESRRRQKIGTYPRGNGSERSRLATSWAQQRLWFIDQLEGDRGVYHIQVGVRLRGWLDQEALRKALSAQIRRHEVLRTVFVSEGGVPTQEIAPTGHFVLTEIDLSSGAEMDREVQVRLQKIEEAQGKFDLRTGPLIRGRLLRLQAEEHILLVRMHHIVSDGWSIGVFLRELAELYGAYREGRSDPLDPLPIQYADYTQWQRQWLLGEALEKQLSYWRASLEGAPPQMELPTDHPRPTVQSYRGENVEISLGAQLSSELKALAQRCEMTLFMVLYAGWAILLSRLSNQEDVVVGTPVANRQRPELEALVGFFVNTLVLRVAARGDFSLQRFLKQVKQVTLEAYDHQDLPFEKVVEALHPQRSLSRNPLFQIMITLQNAQNSVGQWIGLQANLEEGVHQLSKFDFELTLEERGAEIAGNVTYATDLFNRETIERWIGCFKVLLRGMTDEVESRLSDLPILPEGERRQVVEVFNTTEVKYPQRELIHELFEAQVERTPDAVAVVYEEQVLTYSEINGRANQLARYLRSKGVGPDQLVAICVERSVEMVVGLLGILKAGGAYVPLDPNYPTERLQYMLEDSAPKILLTQGQLRQKLPGVTAEVIALDDEWRRIAQSAVDNLQASTQNLGSHHLAYVIYTSGSTGQPKGAMNEHRGVVNRLRWMQEQYRLGFQDRVLQKTPFTFDVSVWEFFWTLMSGARLIIARPEGHKDPTYLRKLIEETDITTLHFVPSMLQIFLDQHPSGGCPSLRHIVCSGEELPAMLQRKCLERLPHASLSNLYGPTEAAVDVTAWECRPEDREPRVPIGRPISNIQMYLLDSYSKPVPIGVSGEIHIGGVGVGRGYLNRPELTAERYLPDPFSADPRARLYKTGDLGRWRADGAIEYLGRNDHQVKIRGFRIELGEIEAQLARHALVKEAVVIAREDIPGEKRLVAYVIAHDPSGAEAVPSVEALRVHLKTTLPEYMVPGAFVMLERLPLSANGKLDRRALPAPDLGAYVSRQFEAPQGELEEILAGIWQGLLRVERVGRQDNFFELGGHSLLIVQMMEQLRRVGLSAEVRRVFESPTLADLAGALTREVVGQFAVPPNLIPPDCAAITPQMLTLVELKAEHIERIVKMVPGGAANIQDIYPLAPLQEGLLFHHLLNEQGGDVYVRPMLLSFSSRGKLGEFIPALQKVIDRHDILRTAVLWEQLPMPVQVVYRQAILPVEEISLDHNRDSVKQLKERMRPDRQRLDLRQAPLVRLQIAADPRGAQCYALLRLHHLVCDNESLEAMLAEVMAHIEGHERALPKPLPYRNHVTQALAHARTHDAEAFFRSKLGAIDEPTAPFGLLDVQGDGSQIEDAGEEVDPNLSLRVRTQSRRLGVSAATLFHAAWGLVIARTSGREDVVFGSVLLGRLQGTAGAQRTLGMFINTLPLRLQLSGVTAKGLVEQTQRELVELLNYEQTPLAVAQRCSGIIGSAPLFSALLNYRHSISGIRSGFGRTPDAKLLADAGRTNYPITLSVDDRGESFALVVETDRRVDPRRMLGYLSTAMQSLVKALEEAPRTPVLSLSILPESERHQVVESFNPTHAVYPQEKLIHELFEEQAQRTPGAIAVVYEGQSVTYAELNGKANQLARYLRKEGVGADQLVAICVERSLEMVIGLLGVLKAGGAYVPMDPNYPADRLQYMLDDAAPRVLLVQERLREKLPESAAKVIALDSGWSEISQQAFDNLDAVTMGLRSHHLAYVIYTSGSTGKPKGVMIEHRNVARLFSATDQWFDFNERDVWTLFHSFAFDFSVWELWGGLLYGGRVVVVPYLTVRSPREFYSLLCREGVTILSQTPSAFAQLIDAQAQSTERHQLRVVIFGGEALELHILRPWVERNGADRTQLVNMYGITETTVHVTYRPLGKNEIESERGSPVGSPIPDLRTYLLDGQRQPVPIGVAGEIYVGGGGVARGYLNRPQLTAERFIADPFSADAKARLYKTGDLGRWRADGTIVYMGRNDQQVKIRGFRIELGEIEAQLAKHDRVRDVTVIAREDVPGEKRLVAYVIPEVSNGAESAPNAEALRAHLKAVLPEYMVPSAFVILESFPLTPNGKLDRRALPMPELGAYASSEYEAPQGEVEEILAGIWQGLLGVERVGRQDNFFELGGHSLYGVKLIAKVAERFMVRLPVISVFQYPTIEQMAGAVESLQLVHGESLNSEGIEFEEGVV
jgi:amino acid adenylation domain-containing protein